VADMYDSTNWTALQTFPGPKAGYIDGAESAWPAEAWTFFAHDPLLRISVLADPAAECFDLEPGNAAADKVAEACAERLGAAKWSVLYTNHETLGVGIQALRTKGIVLTDAQFWPKPAVYLWAADPTGTPHTEVPWAPVAPVAVQDRWFETHDISSTVGAFPGGAIQPPPPPPHPSEVTVNVPQVSAADPGPGVSVPWVASVQALLSARHGHPLTLDGRFGPATDAAVRAFQSQAGIAVDGVVGPVTADHLCNH
jgi:hypothetical protein